MAKERSVNPAQAQRKLEKQKALKKSKAEQQTRRNEKLARRNPARMQRQIDDLKAAEQSRPLSTRDKNVLEELERDLRAVIKAREALGDQAPQFPRHHDGGGRGGHGQRGGRGGRGGGSGSYLGKRRRGSESGGSGGSDSEETDEEVRRIPMPRDTPPPIPSRRRHKNPNMTPLGGDGQGPRLPHALPPKPESQAQAQIPAQTVYESKPVVRDLRKEAVAAFVPAAVQRKLGLQKGEGGRLLEPEEADRLEKEGYAERRGADRGESSISPAPATAAAQESSANADDDLARLQAEQERFERELRTVQVEEVEDEDL